MKQETTNRALKRPAKKQSQETVLQEAQELLAPHKMLRLSAKAFGIILILTGLVGLFASFVLTVDKIHVLKDPSYDPSCNINPVLSCGSVMQSSQAEIAGIPNTLFGLAGFTAVITTGVILLMGGRPNKRFWQLWLVGMIGGLGMMLYLMFQSIYRLGNLCVYCMATWTALLPLIWYSFLWGLQHKYLRVPQALDSAERFVRRNHLGLLILAYLLVIALILQHFWYYFGTL